MSPSYPHLLDLALQHSASSRLCVDLQCGVHRTSEVLEQRLRSRSCEIIPPLRPKAWIPRERFQSRLREQYREHQVRELHYHQRTYISHIPGHLTISSRLWETLGFTKAGLIPNAGRLKKEGGGEEYVDALVFYKSFMEDHRS